MNPSPDAQQIARGHAWMKHRGEFQSISTADEFAEHIENVMQHPTESKLLSRGRQAFWDQTSGTVVIRDPNNPDLGTAFKPTHGKAYFDNLR